MAPSVADSLGVAQVDPSPDRFYFLVPDDLQEQHRLDAILSDGRWNVLVLAGYSVPEVPVPGIDPFATAMRAGIPALLWHPHASPGEMRDLVGDLTVGDGAAKLLARTRALTFEGIRGRRRSQRPHQESRSAVGRSEHAPVAGRQRRRHPGETAPLGRASSGGRCRSGVGGRAEVRLHLGGNQPDDSRSVTSDVRCRRRAAGCAAVRV